MASSSPGPEEILIRVDLAAAAVSMPEADLRRRFWNPLISGGNVPENEFERLERRVSDRFQEGLKERLRSLVPESTSSQENQGRRTFEAATKEDRRPSKEPPAVTQAQKRAALAAAIVVQTRILEYSSAIVGISVEPLAAAVDFFDGHFDYFYAFLSAYVPVTFAQALREGITEDGRDPNNPAINGLSYQVEVPGSVFAAFESEKSKKDQGSVFSKANWLWIASNTSLLIPVAIAVVFLCVQYRYMSEREHATDKAREKFTQAVLGRSKERESSIDKAHEEFMRETRSLISQRIHDRENAVDKAYDEIIRTQKDVIDALSRGASASRNQNPTPAPTPTPTPTPTPAPTPAPPTAISRVQAALAQRGYYQGPLDGIVGPRTRRALRAFQADQGLAVTGRIDNASIQALKVQ